jgi:hypothetical protein
MIDSPEVAGDYYQKIADRIAVSVLLWFMFRCTHVSIGYGFGRKETCHQAPEVLLWRHR